MVSVLVEFWSSLGRSTNASKKSHAELDDAEELDHGNLTEFGLENGNLMVLLPNFHIFGGCCGTDHHHIEEICHHLEG